MPEYQTLTVLAAFAFLYSLVASKLERTPFGGAIIYVLVGLLAGPAALGLVDLHVDSDAIRGLAELTLAVVLFTDSANANLGVLRRFEAIPARMLLIGLPLTILLGFGVGVLLFRDLSFVEIALLATMLAPTDAALGKAVVTNTAVPEPVRESLNVESGLNDGICVPILLLFLTLAADESHRLGPLSLAALLTLQAIGIGAAVGIALGISGSSALRAAAQHGWTAGVWLQIPVVALALLAFGLSQWLGGSGFIAAFVGGMTFGAFTREHRHAVLDAAEGIGNVLAMLTWFAFGTMLFVLPFWTGDWRVFAFAVASLTVIRMLPVYLSVHRLRLRSDTKLFLGWFGPRGLASIVFAVMVIDEHLPGEHILVAVTSWTILLSVLAHGLTANYLAGIYGKRVGDAAI